MTTFIGGAEPYVEASAGPQGEMVLRIHVERAESPENWAEYFRTLQVLTERLKLLPHDILLDEAYRYVSHGGEITENMVRLFVASLPGRGYSPSPDRRVTTVELAVAEYCRQLPNSGECIRGGDLVRTWIRWLEEQAGDGSETGGAL